MGLPNDNFNNNVLGSGWVLVGSGAVEQNSRLEITPASATPVGLRWSETSSIADVAIPFRVLNPSGVGFNSIAMGIELRDKTTGYKIRALFRGGWTARVQYLDGADTVIRTDDSAVSVDSDTFSYASVQWRSSPSGGAPGVEFLIDTASPPTETSRSVVWGNVGLVPTEFQSTSNFNPANVEVRPIAFQLGGTGTALLDDVGGNTGDGNVAGGSLALSPTTAARTIAQGDTSLPSNVTSTVTYTGGGSLSASQTSGPANAVSASVAGGVLTVVAGAGLSAVAQGGPYTVVVTVTDGTLSATLTIDLTVTAPPAGGPTTKALKARGKTAGGAVVPGVPFSVLSNSNPSAATVEFSDDDDFVVTAVAEGSTSIVIQGGGKSQTLAVTVNPAS